MKKESKCVCGYEGKMFLLNQYAGWNPLTNKVCDKYKNLYVCPKCGTVKIG